MSGALPAWVTLAFVLSVTACSRDRDQIASTTTITSATLRVANQEAIAHLMEADCAREEQCAESGEAQPGVREECLAETGHWLRGRLGGTTCPQGVDHGQLEACLQEMRSESCHLPRSASERVRACQTAALCPPGPH